MVIVGLKRPLHMVEHGISFILSLSCTTRLFDAFVCLKLGRDPTFFFCIWVSIVVTLFVGIVLSQLNCFAQLPVKYQLIVNVKLFLDAQFYLFIYLF